MNKTLITLLLISHGIFGSEEQKYYTVTNSNNTLSFNPQLDEIPIHQPPYLRGSTNPLTGDCKEVADLTTMHVFAKKFRTMLYLTVQRSRTVIVTTTDLPEDCYPYNPRLLFFAQDPDYWEAYKEKASNKTLIKLRSELTAELFGPSNTMKLIQNQHSAELLRRYVQLFPEQTR